MQIRFFEQKHQFIYPFTISGGRTKTEQPALVVEFSDEQFIGRGEAPAITYYQISIPEMLVDLEKHQGELCQLPYEFPEIYYPILKQLFPNNSFLRCAIDMAFWNLNATKKQSRVAYLAGLNPKQAYLSDYTLGIASCEEMISKMSAKPWPVYKIKLGKASDIDLLEELRKHTKAPFRIDANAALSFEDTRSILGDLKRLGVELLEQPLAKDELEQMILLKEISPIPLFADESCVLPEDVKHVARGFHGINIKLTKCGGISPALGMFKEAKSLDLKIMLGNMNESSLGTKAMLELASEVDFLDADGPMLLNQANSDGLIYENGYVSLP